MNLTFISVSILFFLQTFFYQIVLSESLHFVSHSGGPLVITTWNFPLATKDGWQEIIKPDGQALDAVVSGCKRCQTDRCGGTVGDGGSPDENGESTLDAMLMDGTTMDVGAVANLRYVREAIEVARDVLIHTEHTLLVGGLATDFAVSMGYQLRNLSTEDSLKIWQDWKKHDCQPNFWKDVTPDPTKHCGPYKPLNHRKNKIKNNKNSKSNDNKENSLKSSYSHDTIGMVAIDESANVAAGTSTNGAVHKIPGRVGDSPIVGSGAYADSQVGGASATGDGDILMRFSPSFHAVELMRVGVKPQDAAQYVIQRIRKHFPNFSGGVIAANIYGDFGAACNGIKTFPFTVMKREFQDIQTFYVDCF